MVAQSLEKEVRRDKLVAGSPGQELGEGGPGLGPVLLGQAHQAVEGGLPEHLLVALQEGAGEQVGDLGQVQDLAECNGI